MNKVVLGRTGLKVSQLALGGLFVSSYGATLDEAKKAVRRAVELGINYIDTAPGYLDSEEVLGRCLEDITAPVILSSKLGGRPQPFNPRDPLALRKSVEESLRLLKRDRIDILMIHEPDRPKQYDWWTDRVNFDGPVMEVLDRLKQEGLIRFTGLGGTTAYEMAHVVRSGKFDVVLTAFNYSILWREAEHEIFPAAKENNVGVVVGSPLQQGALAVRYDEAVQHGDPWLSKPRREQYKALYRFLDEIQIPLPELGYRFVISNPNVHCVLMGAASAAQVEQNVAAVEKGPLPLDILKRLDQISTMVPFRPYEEPFGLPFMMDYIGPGPGGR